MHIFYIKVFNERHLIQFNTQLDTVEANLIYIYLYNFTHFFNKTYYRYYLQNDLQGANLYFSHM